MNNLDSQDPMVEHIRNAVENDRRHPRTACGLYLQGIERLLKSERSILFNGSFFSEFSMYFFRVLTLLLARGDNVVFVCATDDQSKWMERYVRDGLSRLTSFYCIGIPENSPERIDFDDPIWRILRIRGDRDVIEEADVDECSVLITTLDYLCSPDFGISHKKFIHLIDTVIYVDTLTELNRFGAKMAMFHTTLQNIAEVNSMKAKDGSVNRGYQVRYMSRPVRYICFEETRTPGVDKALKNLLEVSFDSVDIMRYTEKTKISCYRLDTPSEADGVVPYPQMIASGENIGLVMNMALFCLEKGAECVSVFPEDLIPYKNYQETMYANAGHLKKPLNENTLRINRYSYDTADYSVIFAIDALRNLPAVLRKYASITAEEPVLLYLFSPPYLFRDYYIYNIESLWSSAQLIRLPMEEGSEKETARKILLKAEAGGICTDDILQLSEGLPAFDEYVQKKNVNAILRSILKLYGIPQEERVDLYRYFEYSPVRGFDENGVYISDDRISLRKEGQLYDTISGNNMGTLVVGDRRITLPVPKDRLTQNYIVYQNLLCRGEIYQIYGIDPEKGEVHARLPVSGWNREVWQYKPIRNYRLDAPDDLVEELFPQMKLMLQCQNGDVEVNEITLSFLRVCTEVITEGYFSIDPMTMDINSPKTLYVDLTDKNSETIAKQTYRRYGAVRNPVYSSESVLQKSTLSASEHGARMMSVRISGKFGSDFRRTAFLAAVMLDEILHSIFPYTADSIAVCPVIRTPFDAEEDGIVPAKHSRLSFAEEGDAFFSTEDFELLVIEDSPSDLGVVNAMHAAGDGILHMLFSPILTYLNWYEQSGKKSRYLYYGLDHEPSCFDFESLRCLAELLGTDERFQEFVDAGETKAHVLCDFCGTRCENASEITELEDGRKMCADCAAHRIGNNREILNAHLERAKQYLESTYGVTFDEKVKVFFEPTEKIRHYLNQKRSLYRRGADVPLLSYLEDSKIHVESSIPSSSLSEVLVRELTHLWQRKYTPDLSEEMAEGHIALTGLQYLRFLNRDTLAAMRTNYYESTGNRSGEGYRKLLHELLNHPEYQNDPFRCMLAMSGIKADGILAEPKLFAMENGFIGRNYIPVTADRCPEGELTYFYYSRLPEAEQIAYDTILTGIRGFADSVTVNLPSETIVEQVTKIADAIRYDHPELFHFYSVAICAQNIQLKYVLSREEMQAANEKIEPVVQKYLEGIDETMSAYDAALRLHIRMIESIDYDTIALKRQKAEGGPSKDKIDELRTIYGVFLNGTAVCEGYARAMQYLLQRCGIECAECVGDIRKDNGETGESHAWNILKVDGDYYYLDVTWDDSSNTVQKVRNNSIAFDYFCITTEELMRTRDLQLCPVDAMPICTADRANYFVHNDLLLTKYDLARIKKVAKEAADLGNPFFFFKCASKSLYDEAVRNLFTEGKDAFEVLAHAASRQNTILKNRYTYQCNSDLRTIKITFRTA